MLLVKDRLAGKSSPGPTSAGCDLVSALLGDVAMPSGPS